ncbi:IPT/TIG domain-containing protein [Rapidithrix thailandica]|uniref:IPT/TIG domain-containing protein n=1 Tax=Rapidithrix thailandica TaxID=413964 RepID=A0AAW9S029_9BACT
MLKFNNLHSIWMTALIVGLGLVLFSCEKDGDEDPVLRIESIEPLTARVGDVVLIKGKGFDAIGSQNTVLFSGEVVSPVFEASSTALKVLVPEGAQNGPLTVKVGKQSAVSSQEFTLDTSLGAPSLTGITPPNGIAGIEITLNGTGFGSDPSVVKVYFGESEVEVSSINNTDIKVKVPVLEPGVVQVRVVREEQASNTLDFTVDPTPVNVRTVYWTTSEEVYKGEINETGAELTKLYELNGNNGIEVDVEGGKIYWANYLETKIFSAPLDGSEEPEVLFDAADGLKFPGGIAIDLDNGRIYVTDADFGEYHHIMGGNLDGSGTLEKLYALPVDPDTYAPYPYGIKLQILEEKLYWTETFTPAVVQGSIYGEASQAPKVLFDASHGLKAPSGVAIDPAGGKVFITDSPSSFEGPTAVDNLYVGSLDGSGGLTALIEPGGNLTLPIDVELDLENGYVFWTNAFSEGTKELRVMRAKLDGSEIEVLFSGQNLSHANFFDLGIY